MTARLNDERSKVVGLASLTDAEGWIKVGEVGLDKLVAKSDVTLLNFGYIFGTPAKLLMSEIGRAHV